MFCEVGGEGGQSGVVPGDEEEMEALGGEESGEFETEAGGSAGDECPWAVGGEGGGYHACKVKA